MYFPKMLDIALQESLDAKTSIFCAGFSRKQTMIRRREVSYNGFLHRRNLKEMPILEVNLINGYRGPLRIEGKGL